MRTRARSVRSPASSESASRSSPGCCSGGVRRIRWPLSRTGAARPPCSSPDDLRRLEDLVREHNDDTLDQLKQRGGFNCSLTTIWCALRRQRLTCKKKTQHADERDRPDVQEKRRSFRRKVKRVEPKRLVFVDESGVTTAMTRAYGWAPRGERAVGSAPSSWESLTVIAALGLDGVRAPLVFPGSTDTAAFES